MTTRQAAKYLGISMHYLRNMRQLLHNHDGPSYTMVYGIPYYNTMDLDAWNASHKHRKLKSRAKVA